MSSDSYRRNIGSLNRDLGSLHTKMASERKKEADLAAKIGRVQSSITKTTSASSLQSKLREIERLNKDIGQSKKRQADISKQIADKEKKKHSYEQSLMKEQQREQKSYQRDQERRIGQYRSGLASELFRVAAVHRDDPPQAPPKHHDVFISHASEDKDSFVRPLAEALAARGVKVWYDEFNLKVGDSLRRSIDRGLADSRYGIVVLSTAFFSKNWPQYELDGLVTKEVNVGEKVVLPIWHEVSKDKVMQYSPSLADKLALNTGLLTLAEIVEQLVDVILPADAKAELTVANDAPVLDGEAHDAE